MGNEATEVKAGMTRPQAKGFWQPPEAGRGEKQILPWRLQREHGPAGTLIWAFRTGREYISVDLSPHLVVVCYSSHRILRQKGNPCELLGIN